MHATSASACSYHHGLSSCHWWMSEPGGSLMIGMGRGVLRGMGCLSSLSLLSRMFKVWFFIVTNPVKVIALLHITSYSWECTIQFYSYIVENVIGIIIRLYPMPSTLPDASSLIPSLWPFSQHNPIAAPLPEFYLFTHSWCSCILTGSTCQSFDHLPVRGQSLSSRIQHCI